MYAVLIRNVAKQGKATEYLGVSKRFAEAMRELPGLVDIRVLVSDDDPNVVCDLLLWESREAAKADDGSTFLRFKPELKPLFDGNSTETFEVF